MDAGRGRDGGRRHLAGVLAIAAAWAALGGALSPAAAQPAGAQPAAVSETEADAWARVKDSANPGDLRAFLAAHPAGRFVRQAQGRLLVLEAKAPPPAPSVVPSVALAYMVRYDAVAQMIPKLGAPPAPARAAAAPAPLQVAELTTNQPRNAAAASASPPPAAAAPEPAPPQVPAASPPAPAPTTIPATTASTTIAPPGPAAEPPPAPVQVAVAAPPPPIAPRPQSSDPMVRPEMIEFDVPVLPRSFCAQQDMNSFLTDFHTPLDQAAKANNQTATEHYNRLKARFGELAANAAGTDAFVAVDTELKAYDGEAKARYAMAAKINDLDAKIRLIPIDPAEGCAHAPWPQPVRGQAQARAAAAGD